MIKVDRTSVEAPSSLRGSVAELRRRAAADFFTSPETERKQKRFDFGLQFAHPELRGALRQLFHDKCAYCEKHMSVEKAGSPYLDRFRPTSGAIGKSGDVTPDAYWWLAFEWSNMYASCAQCNRSKASRFPIQGKRAAVQSTGFALVKERALLLDPCKDNPDTHLLFDENGFVSGRTLKGRTTVEVLNLNRPELVSQRLKEAKAFAVELARSTGTPSALLDPTRPFAALRKQLFAWRNTRQELTDEVRRARQAQTDLQKLHGSFSLSDPKRDVRRERARTRYVEHISLKHVGIHEKVELTISSEGSSRAPWMMLLGENGVGKSTVLKAVAFALAGEAEWDRIGRYAQALLPLGRNQDEHVGDIKLRLSDGEEIHLRIDATARRVTGNAKDARLYFLAFGATRLPANDDHRPPEEPSYARIANLFDPFAPLGDAVRWLSSLSDVQFERAGRTLKSLLDLPDEAIFTSEVGAVMLHEGGLKRNVKTLSDGYQTIIGVGCDIMSVLLGPDLPIEHAEGIVLIDEIGNHLHPTWRMRIIEALKRSFPRVQFIATTHEPLCLRGLDNDEVAVLRKDKYNKVHLLENLPPIRGLLVDQILSSPHFGLRSTIDPKFAAQLDQYYDLIARPELSAAEERHLEALTGVIASLRLVGDSPREQVLLRTIDNYLAKAEEAFETIDPASIPADLQTDLMRLLEASEPSAGTNDKEGVQ